MTADAFRFEQLHIEVARNATDDFNPFHDKKRWGNIRGNPFSGPILLGFQLECLIEQQVRLYRERHADIERVRDLGLGFSNYNFRFLGAVRAGQDVSVEIRDTRIADGDTPVMSNKVIVHVDGKVALTGQKRESARPFTLPDADLGHLKDLRDARDRAFIEGESLFLKRKFITTSNAKNFMSSSLVEQSDYIDEIAGLVQFPEMFPCALLSNALLERAHNEGHDFEQEPMIYRSHAISVDRDAIARLRSNDALHLLIHLTNPDEPNPEYECYGVVGSGPDILFRAVIKLVALAHQQLL